MPDAGAGTLPVKDTGSGAPSSRARQNSRSAADRSERAYSSSPATIRSHGVLSGAGTGSPATSAEYTCAVRRARIDPVTPSATRWW